MTSLSLSLTHHRTSLDWLVVTANGELHIGISIQVSIVTAFLSIANHRLWTLHGTINTMLLLLLLFVCLLLMLLTYKAGEFSQCMVVAVLHLLAVVDASSARIRELAPCGAVLYIPWVTWTTLV